MHLAEALKREPLPHDRQYACRRHEVLAVGGLWCLRIVAAGYSRLLGKMSADAH